jgi:arylsulfatase A-like enzyme
LDRRSFIKTLSLGAGISVISGDRKFAELITQHKTNKPNIIFILADDLGYGDLGCYGQKKIKTPFIDKMADEGIRFTSAYSGSPVCAPSRNCLMTGQHTGHTTIRHNSSFVTKERIPLNPNDFTVAQLLKENGYTTGLIGKWGLGEPDSTGHPNKKGFDYFFGFLNQKHAHSHYPDYLWRNEEKIFLPENQNDRRKTYAHDLFAKESLEFIENNKSNPFFLHLTFTIPHAELLVPDDSLKEYLGEFTEDKPFIGNSAEGYSAQPYPHAAYAAMITRMDRDIGKLFKKLKETGIDDNTIVFLSSDNGPSSAGGIDPEFFNSNGSLRGEKYNLYEGGIRIPMIVRYPYKIKSAAVSDEPIMFCDFLPTVAELINTSAPPHVDGISVLPSLRGKSLHNHRYLYWEIKNGKKEFNQAVRMGKWKAVRINPDKVIELYDLSTDISEKNDVSGKNRPVVEEIEKYLSEAHHESKHWPMFS